MADPGAHFYIVNNNKWPARAAVRASWRWRYRAPRINNRPLCAINGDLRAARGRARERFRPSIGDHREMIARARECGVRAVIRGNQRACRGAFIESDIDNGRRNCPSLRSSQRPAIFLSLSRFHAPARCCARARPCNDDFHTGGRGEGGG